MKANVELTLLGNQVIPGHVVSVDMLSSVNWREWDERLRRFLVRVRLDRTPASALPFMSASVEFDTGRVESALVIPVEALAVEHGRQSCLLRDRRPWAGKAPITTRRANRDFLEVTGGLSEGERVIFRSSDAEGLPHVDRRRPARQHRELTRNERQEFRKPAGERRRRPS